MSDSDYIKASNVFSQVETMKPLIWACDWAGLEEQSELRCLKRAGDTDTRRISGISLRAYQEALTSALSLAVTKCKASGAKAI